MANLADVSGSSLLLMGALLAGVQLDADDDALLTPQVDGGMYRSGENLIVRLAQSHGRPGKAHEVIGRWGKRVGWQPGIYVDCDPECPYATGIDVLLITNIDDNEN
jgi:hypothetical protein